MKPLMTIYMMDDVVMRPSSIDEDGYTDAYLPDVPEGTPDVVELFVRVVADRFDEYVCDGWQHESPDGDVERRPVGWTLHEDDDTGRVGERFWPFAVVVPASGAPYALCEDCVLSVDRRPTRE